MHIRIIVFVLLFCSLEIAVEGIEFSGNVRPKEQVLLVSKVAGRLESVFVDVGEHVKKGQVLAQIETYDFIDQVREAEARFRSAKASLEQVRATAEINSNANFARALANVKRLEMALLQAEIDVKVQAIQVESTIKRSAAQLRASEAELEMAKIGSRPQELEQGRARYENAKQNYERLTALQKEDFVSQDQLDRIRLEFELAKAEYELLREGTRKEQIEMIASNVEIARAGLEIDKANAEQLQVTHVNVESVKAQLEEGRVNLRLAEITKNEKLWQLEIDSAEANVLQAQASLDLVKRQLEEATLRSPIDGIIATRELDPGPVIPPNQPVFTIVNISDVRIHGNVSEKTIPTLNKVAEVQVVMKDSQSSEVVINQTLKPLMIRFSPIMDGMTQTAEVIIEVNNPQQRLKPGALVTIRIPGN